MPHVHKLHLAIFMSFTLAIHSLYFELLSDSSWKYVYLGILLYTNMCFIKVNEKAKLYNQQSQTEIHTTSGLLETLANERTTRKLQDIDLNLQLQVVYHLFFYVMKILYCVWFFTCTSPIFKFIESCFSLPLTFNNNTISLMQPTLKKLAEDGIISNTFITKCTKNSFLF